MATYIYRATDPNILNQFTQTQGNARTLTVNDADGVTAVTPAGSLTFQHRVWKFNDVPDNTDIEVLMRIYAQYDNASTFDVGPAVRINSTGQYAVGSSYTRTLPHRFINTAGSTTTLSSASALEDIVGVYSWRRYRVESGPDFPVLKIKAWAGELEDEPAAWGVNTTDAGSLNTSAGGAGWTSQDTELWRWTHISVGTGGDTAPDPRESGGSTINDSITVNNSQDFESLNTVDIHTLLNLLNSIQLDSANFFELFESLQLSNVFVINIDNKSVFINTSPTDIGRVSHPYVSWSDTAIELGSISKQGFEGYIYYFKVSNNGETDWYGPIVINEVHNSVLQIASNFDIISTIVQLGTINELINLNKSYSINNYTIAVLRGFIELAHHLQHYILAYDLSSINAFITITKELNLSIDTQALLNALVVMLQNNSITMNQLNAVLNAVMQLAPSYTTLINSSEPPVFWQVRTFKIKIGE